MARKNIVPNFSMFGAAGADMSLSSTASAITEVQNTDNIGILLNWAGTSPVGAVTIDVSNDQILWESLDFGLTIDISGNTGSHLIDISQIPYGYIRAVYTKASGIGTLFGSLSTKQVGG